MQFVFRNNFLSDKFLNLHGVGFHIFTPKSLIERSKRDVEKMQ